MNLALIEQGSSQKNLIEAQKTVSEAQNRFAYAQKDMLLAEDKLVDAK